MTTQSQSITQQIIGRHDQYMSLNYGRYPIAMVRGQGARLWDAEGKEYLDLFAGFGAGILGHCHPDLVRAVTEQAQRLWHPGNLMHSEPQTLLAEQIAAKGFGGRSFFCHSGADANEAAFKLARLHGKKRPGKQGPRFKIVSTIQSFHGRTFATMMATGQEKVRQGYEPFLEGFLNVSYNDLKAMEQAIDEQTIAIIVEPIQGEGGVNVPDQGYLAGLRRLCDQHDMLLIFDEVWTGCGRTGRYFAHQHWSVEPDMMTLAKGVGGGLAVGVMCANPAAAELFDHRGHGGVAHATTLGGNCLSMAVAATVFQVIERDNLLDHAAQLGQHVTQRLETFGKRHGIIRRVRGKGLFLGIELDRQPAGGAAPNLNDIVHRCLGRGVLVNGTQGNIVRLAPSLTISQADLDAGLGVLEDVLSSCL